MKRENILLEGSGGQIPISPGVRVGQLLFTSGHVGRIKGTTVIPETIEEQTRVCFENLIPVLKKAGTGLDRVVKATVYLTNMSDFAGMNEIYREFFRADFPARTTVGIAALANPNFKVEIDLIALVEKGGEDE